MSYENSELTEHYQKHIEPVPDCDYCPFVEITDFWKELIAVSERSESSAKESNA